MKVARGQSPPPPPFGLWRSGASLVWWGECMRGRCLGKIVDQLVLGRFLADLCRFLIYFGNIGPKRKCEENRAKICDFEARGSQNQPKWCPGALRKRPWEQVGSRLLKKAPRLPINLRLLAPLGRFWAPFWAQLGAKGLTKSSFLAPSHTKISKNEAQNEASKNI